MKRIKEALEQARQDGILKKSSVVGNVDVDVAEAVAEPEKPEQEPAPRQAVNIAAVDLNRELLRRNLVFQGKESDSFSMAYKMLRTQVYQKMSINNWTTLGITSATSGEGKSLTSINLAFSLSRAAARPVVLVDLDLRRPSLISKLGISTELGVSDFLVRGAGLQNVLLKISENLILAPGTEDVIDASEILSSVHMARLLRELRDTLPDALIIFDLPPVLMVDDVLALSPSLDACILVAEEGRTQRDDLQQALDMLQMTNLLGVVLNKSGEMANNHYYDKY